MSPDGTKGVQSRIVLTITLDTEEEARRVVEALKVDDDDYVRTSVEGCMVRGEVGADSVEGVRRAADDWLACLMAVVKEDRSDTAKDV
ncbi:MAG: KEOPS complex subunit Pcc1 [Thermoplasmatota archaeon]